MCWLGAVLAPARCTRKARGVAQRSAAIPPFTIAPRAGLRVAHQRTLTQRFRVSPPLKVAHPTSFAQRLSALRQCPAGWVAYSRARRRKARRTALRHRSRWRTPRGVAQLSSALSSAVRGPSPHITAPLSGGSPEETLSLTQRSIPLATCAPLRVAHMRSPRPQSSDLRQQCNGGASEESLSAPPRVKVKVALSSH